MADARRVAIFREEAGPWRPAAGSRCRRARSSPSPATSSSRAGRGERLLATSIVWSRGWSARAGGRPAPILKVDSAFLGVRLPAGPSRLELRFLPPGLLAGCLAFALSGLTLLRSAGGGGWPAVLVAALSGKNGRGRRGGGPGSGVGVDGDRAWSELDDHLVHPLARGADDLGEVALRQTDGDAHLAAHLAAAVAVREGEDLAGHPAGNVEGAERLDLLVGETEAVREGLTRLLAGGVMVPRQA